MVWHATFIVGSHKEVRVVVVLCLLRVMVGQTWRGRSNGRRQAVTALGPAVRVHAGPATSPAASHKSH